MRAEYPHHGMLLLAAGEPLGMLLPTAVSPHNHPVCLLLLERVRGREVMVLTLCTAAAARASPLQD